VIYFKVFSIDVSIDILVVTTNFAHSFSNTLQ